MINVYDEDLEFLSKVDSEDLDNLVFILNFDNAKKQEYMDEIAKKGQILGFNSFASFFKNKKYSLYKEILFDVCKQLEVDFDETLSTKTVENILFMKILKDAIYEMSREDFRKMIDKLKKEKVEGLFDFTQVVSKQVVLEKFQLFFEYGDFKSYILIATIVNAILKALIGRGLSAQSSICANSSMQFMKFLVGPIGWLITGIWAVTDIVEPEYKVIVSTVIYVAYLRQKYIWRV